MFVMFLFVCLNLGSLRIAWDLFITIILAYICIEVPFTLAFEIDLDLKHWSGILSFTIDVLLCCDVLVTFRTAYFDNYDSLHLITSPVRIAKRYFFRCLMTIICVCCFIYIFEFSIARFLLLSLIILRIVFSDKNAMFATFFVFCFVCVRVFFRYLLGWFWVDVITSFPFEFVFESRRTVIFIKAFRIFRVIRIVKLIRFIKMIRTINDLIYRLFSREFVVILRLFRFCCVMILFVHFGACAWYSVGLYSMKHESSSWIIVAGIDDTNANLFEKYSTSWYFSVVTLMTTGYGDIVATNTAEQWVASVFILIGTCFFGMHVCKICISL